MVKNWLKFERAGGNTTTLRTLAAHRKQLEIEIGYLQTEMLAERGRH